MTWQKMTYTWQANSSFYQHCRYLYPKFNILSDSWQTTAGAKNRITIITRSMSTILASNSSLFVVHPLWKGVGKYVLREQKQSQKTISNMPDATLLLCSCERHLRIAYGSMLPARRNLQPRNSSTGIAVIYNNSNKTKSATSPELFLFGWSRCYQLITRSSARN